MPVHEGAFEPGTPCWADVIVDEVESATSFYADLFGWEFQALPPEAGGYVMAYRDGHVVAGLGPKGPGREQMASSWTCYLATTDAEATVALAQSSGGVFFTDPLDVLELAQMAIGADAAGAVFGIWQGKAHSGADLVNEPGALCWAESLSRDYALSLDFYRDVFGYRLHEVGQGGFRYSIATLDSDPDRPVSGVGAIPSEAPTDLPSHWMPYFAVADCDRSAARVSELGATVVQPPLDTPNGRVALVAGPQGETFSLMQMNPAPAGSRG
ncbi:MAG: VOC family protein [Humibacillus sp.]|nr:VOC family protein [Humibacillus sp.]MDN5779096.1 VOC family protein [Humibacillus sp.]